MAKKLNKTCVVCGNKYTFCPNCSSKNAPAWKNVFCDENCKDVYDIVTGYRDGKITANEANDKLSKCDLNDLDTFETSFKDFIEKIKLNATKNPVKKDEDVKEKKIFKKED